MTHSADDSVSFGKMSRVRLRAWHILSNHRAVTLHDRCCKRRISQGIDSVNSRAKNSYRLPASFDSFPVCSRVNAIGEPADHTQTSFTKLLRPLLCLLQTVSARIPGPDHCDTRMIQHSFITLNPQKRRRIIDMAQQFGIIGIIESDKFCSGGPGSLQNLINRFPLPESEDSLCRTFSDLFTLLQYTPSCLKTSAAYPFFVASSNFFMRCGPRPGISFKAMRAL